MLDTL